MSINLKMIDFQKAQDEISKALGAMTTGKFVTVGIHESAEQPEGAGITMAQLGATQHFGADINHPGGTRYQVGSDGMATFVRNDFTGPVTGVTQPHKIKIPARPWLDVGVASGNKEYIEIIGEGLAKQEDPVKILNQVGNVAVGYTQQFMTNLQSPPNAASTIAQKGSSNPLINTGAMRGSVTYALSETKPEEGLA